MKKIITFISMFLFTLIITACGGGGSCGAGSNAINYVLPNGSTLSVPAGGTSMSIIAGESVSTSITISGGSAGLDVLLSSSVKQSMAGSKQSVNTALESQIAVKFDPQSLTSGGTSSSKITVVVATATPAGTYLVNLKASYVYQGKPAVATEIGTITIVVTGDTPPPTPVPGTIAFSPESTTMAIGESFTTVLTLSGAQGLTSDVVVTLSSSSESAIVSPATCTLSIAANTCNVVVTAESIGSVSINATAAGYTIGAFTSNNIVVGPFVYVANYNDNTISMYRVKSSTGELIALSTPTVANEGGPRLIVVSGGYAYVANYIDKTISMYRVESSTGELVALSPARIATGAGPLSMVVSGGYAYTTNAGENTISMFRVNPSTGGLIDLYPSTVGTEGTPSSMVVSGGYAYVIQDNNTILMYSVNSSTGVLTTLSTATVATGSSPSSIVVGGGYAYVINSGDKTISMYSVNSSTGALTALSPATVATGAGSYSIAFYPSGS